VRGDEIIYKIEIELAQKQTSRLAKNTVALFARQIFIIFINLYTIRVILKNLGVEDFALYNVILNVVMIGSFLTISLNTMVQRFFAFAMGNDSRFSLKQVHDAGLVLTLLAAVVSIVGFETIGLWFVGHELVIAPERFAAAQILYQLLGLAFVFSLFSTFHSSVIMAHEDMHAFALISVLDAILRLAAAVTLTFFATDHLVLYGALFAGVALILALNFFAYSYRRYEECRWRGISLEVPLLREMLGFSGWTIFGQITTVSRNQAVTILVNQAFNPATVAARAISTSVGAQILTFSRNFSLALQPPIIKAYAAGEHEQTAELIHFGSKVTFFLVWMATLPVIATAPGILHLWLGNPPTETVLFTQLALIENAIVAISLPLMTAVRATGRVRLYELVLGTLQALVLILSWVAIKFGAAAYVVYVIAIVINLLMLAARLWITRLLVGLPLGPYTRSVLVPVFLVVTVSSGAVFGLLQFVPQAARLMPGVVSLGAVALVFALPVFVIGMFGLSARERAFILSAIRRKLSKSQGKP